VRAVFAPLLVLALLPQKAEVRVAAASDLSFVLREIAPLFERRSGGAAVKLSFGSSGNFHGQIWSGAPFDVFFSADAEYARRLDEAGLVEPGSRAVYAIGRLALWVPNGSPLDLERAGAAALAEPSVRKVAIANPAHAPYGRAALAALRHYGLSARVEPKLVYGENVLQAAQFVQSGAADAGMVALSIALDPSMRKSGRYWIVPDEAHPPIEQTVVVLKRARAAGTLSAAQAFVDWVRGPEGRAILERWGFRVPRERGR
jgi:molybdate transport system substrate-binding protein